MSEETKVDEALCEKLLKLGSWGVLDEAAACRQLRALLNERRHRNAEAAPPSVLEALKEIRDICANRDAVVMEGVRLFGRVARIASTAIASAEAAEGRAKGEADGYLHDDGHFTWATPSHRDAYASQFAGWQRKPFYLSPQPPAVEGAGLNTSMATGYKHWRDCFEAGVYPSDEESYSSGWADGQAALSATPPPGLRGPDFPSFDAGWRAALELDRRTPPTVLAAFKQWQAATAGAAS